MEPKAVSLYIVSGIRGPSRRAGKCLYILETMTAKGPATLTKVINVEGENENGATLAALTDALKRITQPCHLSIYLDTVYIAMALEKRWPNEWKYHDWKNARGKQVCDAAKWQEAEYLLDAHEYRTELKKPYPYRAWMEREARGENKNTGKNHII